MAMHGLPRGGAETFFVRLAKALSTRHELICYVPCLPGADTAHTQTLQGINIASIPAFTRLGYKVFYKLNLMLKPLAIEARLHDHLLRQLHRQHRFQVVNPHLMEATRQVCSAYRTTPLPIAESDHGGYAAVDPAHPGPALTVFQRLNALICPTPVNVEKSQRFPWHPGFRTYTIPYGYDRPAIHPAPRKDSTFTFGLVARGVPEKGWHEAIAAARLLRPRLDKPIRLVLVGAGPAIDSLRATVTEPWITFTGHQDRPEEFIQQFDVGLLPSYLPEESLPNSIIEYLSASRPVIATPIGGIPAMVGNAGLLVPLAPDGKASIPALTNAMHRLATEPGLVQHMSAHATTAALQYRMDTCVSAYEAVFASLSHPHPAH